MTYYSHVRVDLHNNGDCDAATCPLCELEDEQEAADLIVCDRCQQETDEWRTCLHGWTYCPDCGLCRDCAVEERRP